MELNTKKTIDDPLVMNALLYGSEFSYWKQAVWVRKGKRGRKYIRGGWYHCKETSKGV